MVHEDKIQKIIIRVEFDCRGRTAFIDAEVGMELLTSPIALRKALDISIEGFFLRNPPSSTQ